MNGVLVTLALVLAAETGSPAAARDSLPPPATAVRELSALALVVASPVGAADDSTGVAAARIAAPPDSFLRELSALALPRVRVTMSGRRYELVQPLFTQGGIGWRSVEGFPRPRPAVFVGADWDSLKAPPNPVPWPEVGQLESVTWNTRPGAVTGAVLGFVFLGLPAIGLVAAADTYDYTFDASRAYPVAIGFAILMTVGGFFVGRALIPGTPVWSAIPLPPEAGAAPRDAGGSGP